MKRNKKQDNIFPLVDFLSREDVKKKGYKIELFPSDHKRLQLLCDYYGISPKFYIRYLLKKEWKRLSELASFLSFLKEMKIKSKGGEK